MKSCPDCGITLQILNKKGSTFFYLEIEHLKLTSDIFIPSCINCNECFIDGHKDKELNELLKKDYENLYFDKVTVALNAIMFIHNIKLNKIEQFCGVPPSYLRHVLNRKIVPNPFLVRMLEVYAKNPSIFANDLSHRDKFGFI